MSEVRVRTNIQKVMNQIKKDLDWAIISALNKTAVSARAQIIKFIREGYNIKASEARSRIKIERATSNKPVVTFKVDNKSIGLFSFGGKATKRGKGATAMVKRGQRKLYKGAFVATMKSGHEGIFRRIDEWGIKSRMMGGNNQTKHNQKIVELGGPSVQQLFASDVALIKLEKILEDTFYKKLKDQLNYKFK